MIGRVVLVTYIHTKAHCFSANDRVIVRWQASARYTDYSGENTCHHMGVRLRGGGVGGCEPVAHAGPMPKHPREARRDQDNEPRRYALAHAPPPIVCARVTMEPAISRYIFTLIFYFSIGFFTLYTRTHPVCTNWEYWQRITADN